MLAGGFSIQCCALFDFGRKANESAGTLLKLSAASTNVKEKINEAPIDNLNEKKVWDLLHMKLIFEVYVNLNLLQKTILNKSNNSHLILVRVLVLVYETLV